MNRGRDERDSRVTLASLKRQIRDNERIWSGFRGIEIRIIGARSLRELVALLATELAQAFPSVDCVTVACVDAEYEMSRLLEQDGDSPLPDRSFITLATDELNRLFQPPYHPRLGPCDSTIGERLFPGCSVPLRSMALAPLVLRGGLIGCLNQGSVDPGHFTPSTATDLLEHLAAVTAMCLDNAVNHERLKLDGLTDPLTRVANRRFFERRLAEEVERWSRRNEPLACLLADVDYFKRVNDQYGHQFGDRVLQRVAELLGRDLRATDLLARYGGEEFVLLLPNTDSEQAAAIAERLRRRLSEQAFDAAGGQRVAITASFGVACLDAAVVGPAEGAWLLQQADAALYRAKRAGRDRVECEAGGESGGRDFDDRAAGGKE